MDEERIQRQMDFILNQQAKFAEDISRLEQQTKENREDIAKLVVVVSSLANHVERHEKEIAALIEHGKETDRRFKETDERINALILLAEKFFNKNGQ